MTISNVVLIFQPLSASFMVSFSRLYYDVLAHCRYVGQSGMEKILLSMLAML